MQAADLSRRPGKFFWKLFLGHALLLIVVVGTCVYFILDAFDRFYAHELSQHLRTHAEILRYQVEDLFEEGDAAALAMLATLAREVGDSGGAGFRVTFIAADGTVYGDSESDPTQMESHADRAEVLEALRNGIGKSTRWSSTVERDMQYVALRLGTQDEPLGFVRCSMLVRSIVARTRAARKLFWTIAVVVLAAAVALALGLARLWSNPIARITATARSLSQGDLSARPEVSGSDEVALLAQSLNQMRRNLAAQLDTIDRQRRTLSSLLAQLHEGVVVAGQDGRIVLVNPTAARLLQMPGNAAQQNGDRPGLLVQECVGHAGIRRLLTPTAGGLPPGDESRLNIFSGMPAIQEQRFTIEHPQGNVVVLARASDILLPSREAPSGASETGLETEQKTAMSGRLLVLTDITELTRTIQVKADFVANASHELRTPLAAIRAAVETLMSIDVAHNTASAQQLMSVIDRHSTRLEEMVSDLLDLSRLEAPGAHFEAEAVRLTEVIADLNERYASRLHEKRLHWHTAAPPEDEMLVSAQLLRLVLDNLVDNAIKFTDEGGHIRLLCERRNDTMCITVADDGCGIPPEDHDRVFERFYQVERSRTGTSRGTGLGLAIVRHSVNAMGGAVELESAPGQGTRIMIRVPQPAAAAV